MRRPKGEPEEYVLPDGQMVSSRSSFVRIWRVIEGASKKLPRYSDTLTLELGGPLDSLRTQISRSRQDLKKRGWTIRNTATRGRYASAGGYYFEEINAHDQTPSTVKKPSNGTNQLATHSSPRPTVEADESPAILQSKKEAKSYWNGEKEGLQFGLLIGHPFCQDILDFYRGTPPRLFQIHSSNSEEEGPQFDLEVMDPVFTKLMEAADESKRPAFLKDNPHIASYLPEEVQSASEKVFKIFVLEIKQAYLYYI